MAKSYNPKSILQLLKICSWKSKSTLNFSGFETLGSAINGHKVASETKKSHPEIKQKYLSDLLKDTSVAIDSAENVNRNADHIDAVLHYIGFASWKTFEEKVGIIGGFIDPSKIDYSKFGEIKISIFHDKPLTETCYQTLAYPKNSMDINIVKQVATSTEISTVLSEVLETTKEAPHTIWIIHNNWNDALKVKPNSEQINEIMTCGQIIPIRMGETTSEQNLRCSFINNNHETSGEIGLYIALAAIENLHSELSGNTRKKQAPFGLKTKIETLNNSGSLIIGDQNITGENIALGNFIQNINKKED